MSRYMTRPVEPYVPGEQPSGGYLKLNTNESPFAPSPSSISMAADAVFHGELYPDPECKALCVALASELSVRESQILCANGSDAILNYAFAAFCGGEGAKNPVYADLTYGFYASLSQFYALEPHVVHLGDDFDVDVEAFANADGVVFLPNPNAPTGIALGLDRIERIVSANHAHGNVVVIDEAYVDFGAESAVGLIFKYDNLLVTRTFSKSRNLAGARLGFAVGDESLIRDLKAIKYSIDPYCVARSTIAAGIGSLRDREYFRECRERIIKSRSMTAEGLSELGFFVTDSKANFVFARRDGLDGGEFYRRLRAEGILVRHFGGRAEDFVRVTVGKSSDMKRFLEAVGRIVK